VLGRAVLAVDALDRFLTFNCKMSGTCLFFCFFSSNCTFLTIVSMQKKGIRDLSFCGGPSYEMMWNPRFQILALSIQNSNQNGYERL
jgi:hypothetical protein